MESSAEQRLRLIQAHLIPDADDSLLRISANPTAGEFVHGIMLFCVYRRDYEYLEIFFPAELVLCLFH